jgi:hypothetical protein
MELEHLEQAFGEAILYCAPSTSGGARRFWDEKIWMGLLKYLKK